MPEHRDAPDVDDAPDDVGCTAGGAPFAADTAAFRHLFETHFDQLYRFIYRYVQSAEEAEDLVHDVFLRVWRGRGRMPLHGDLRAYLYTLARNRALDHLRHQQIVHRWQSYVAPAIVERALVVPPEGEERVAGDEVIAAIRRAIDALPPRQREVLLLRWQRQATYDEIAQVLDISPKTVEIHMSRALQQLRNTLPDLLG